MRINVELLLFCLVWATLAIAGVMLGGWTIGLTLAIIVFLAISASTAIILSRSGDLAMERKMRWAIVIGGWIAFLLYLGATP